MFYCNINYVSDRKIAMNSGGVNVYLWKASYILGEIKCFPTTLASSFAPVTLLMILSLAFFLSVWDVLSSA